MKARIPPKSKYSKKELAVLTEIAKDDFNKFVENDMGVTDRRYKKLFAICLSMDERMAYSYGVEGWKRPWGKKNIQKLIDMVEAVSNFLDKNDEITWEHIDKRCEQIGLSFEKEKPE